MSVLPPLEEFTQVRIFNLNPGYRLFLNAVHSDNDILNGLTPNVRGRLKILTALHTSEENQIARPGV
jgi:hypothetical protein